MAMTDLLYKLLYAYTHFVVKILAVFTNVNLLALDTFSKLSHLSDTKANAKSSYFFHLAIQRLLAAF